MICWEFRTKIKCCLTHNFVTFTIFQQNGVIFLIIWWLYDGRHILYMAVGVHIVRRPSTARTAPVVQREYGLKVDRLTAENMRLDSVLINGKGNSDFCLAVE